MSKFIINGGNKLSGYIKVEGAKNSILPILSASILNGQISVIKNCPQLKDVKVMTEILKSIGCKVYKDTDTIIVDSSTINTYEVPENLVKEMRSSIVMMGAMLSRFKRCKISYPGAYASIW